MTNSNLNVATAVAFVSLAQYDEVASTLDQEVGDGWKDAIEATLEDGRFTVHASDAFSHPERIKERAKATLVALGARTKAAVEVLESQHGCPVRIEESEDSCPGFRFIVGVEDDLGNATDFLFAYHRIGALVIESVKDLGFSLSQANTDVSRHGGPEGPLTPLWDIQGTPGRLADAVASERDDEGRPAYWSVLQKRQGGFGDIGALLAGLR